MGAFPFFLTLFLSNIHQIDFQARIVYDVELDGTVIKINSNYETVAMETENVTT